MAIDFQSNAIRLTMRIDSFQFPTISPLVSRHAEDAAFYWTQLDRAIDSPQIGFERLQHFDRLLNAHLDGLSVAGPAGWSPASAALGRWKKAGEAFACCWLGLHEADIERLDDLITIAAKHPEQLARGLISALAATSTVESCPTITRWSSSRFDTLAQVIALRTVALIGASAVAHLAEPPSSYLSSSDAHVRAAACRAMAVADRSNVDMPSLQRYLGDVDLQVRAEAAIALAKLGEIGLAVPCMIECVLKQASIHQGATGWNQMQAARRLQRWVNELAWHITDDGVDTTEIASLLPPRMALIFTLYHRDLSYLPFVTAQMTNPDVSRYAGWVWQTLSGLDLAANRWTMPELAVSKQDAKPTLSSSRDADNGLPQPNVAAIRAYMATRTYSEMRGARMLLGRELDFDFALELLETAHQSIRSLAARALNQMQSVVHIDIRASVCKQLRAIATLRLLRSDGALHQ